MNKQKLCRDCKHCNIMEVDPYGNKFMCHAVNINLVDGRSSPEPCTEVRGDAGLCKPEGGLFEPKELALNGDRPTDYLLFSRTSSDGREKPDYIGRTSDRSEAYQHYKKVSANSFDSGFVQMVTDKEVKSLWRDEDWVCDLP